MKRFTQLTMAIAAMTFCSQAWIGAVAPAQATTVIDTFKITAIGKQWCQGNPKFFEAFTIEAEDNITVTITRDVLNTGDLTNIQVKINNSGHPEIDVITMNGRGFPVNTSGSKAELGLSGVNPGNNAHFFNIRGPAKFDTLGSLTQVTGSFGNQITDTYTLENGTESAPVECISKGTFSTGEKL